MFLIHEATGVTVEAAPGSAARLIGKGFSEKKEPEAAKPAARKRKAPTKGAQ